MPRHRQACRANGFSQPSMFGAMPPVTIRPTPPRARSAKIRGELVEIARVILEARVHRAHQHAVGQRREAEVERCEEVRVGCLHGIRTRVRAATMHWFGRAAQASPDGIRRLASARPAARSTSDRRPRAARPDVRSAHRAAPAAAPPAAPVRSAISEARRSAPNCRPLRSRASTTPSVYSTNTSPGSTSNSLLRNA